VCLGKEWYRFPSSFNIPQGVHAKFVKSEFSGLLPGEFSEADASLGLFPGTWLVPSGMNDENLEDPSKYVGETPMNYVQSSLTLENRPILSSVTSLSTPIPLELRQQLLNPTTFLIQRTGRP
jgi:hypothetical protein